MSGAVMEEYYLCDACAQERGVLERGSSLSIASLLKGIIETGGLPGDADRLCPSCGRSLERIKREGRLGCAYCAESFAEEISVLLKRLGAKPLHKGRARSEREAGHAQSLRKRLAKALEAENYEEAARLRDALKEGGK
jgi:protein arginine kinase activator